MSLWRPSTAKIALPSMQHRRPPAEFWNLPSVVRTQRALDCWGSWRKAQMARCDAPTLDSVFESPPRMVAVPPPWYDELRRLWIVADADDERYALYRKTSDPGSPVAEIGLGVELALESAGLLGMAQGPLLAAYPRTGPYAAPTLPEAQQRAVRAMERLAIRALIESRK